MLEDRTSPNRTSRPKSSRTHQANETKKIENHIKGFKTHHFVKKPKTSALFFRLKPSLPTAPDKLESQDFTTPGPTRTTLELTTLYSKLPKDIGKKFKFFFFEKRYRRLTRQRALRKKPKKFKFFFVSREDT